MAKMKTPIAAACLSIMLMTLTSPALAAAFLQASSTEEQFATDTKPKAISMNSTDASKGLTNQNGVVTAPEDGTYFVVAAGQVGSKPGVKGTVRLWLRVNGKDVDNSNCEQSILDSAFTTVLVSQGLAELKKGDKVEAVFSGTVPGVGLIVRKPAGEPVVPSIIFSAYKID
jgi:hypothetical protein